MLSPKCTNLLTKNSSQTRGGGGMQKRLMLADLHNALQYDFLSS